MCDEMLAVYRGECERCNCDLEDKDFLEGQPFNGLCADCNKVTIQCSRCGTFWYGPTKKLAVQDAKHSGWRQRNARKGLGWRQPTQYYCWQCVGPVFDPDYVPER